MTDRYSKIVLTVIAIALVCIVVQNAVTSLNAQTGVQRVAICDPQEPGHCAAVARTSPTNAWFYLVVSQGVR